MKADLATAERAAFLPDVRASRGGAARESDLTAISNRNAPVFPPGAFAFYGGGQSDV